jgi:uncharacterized protein
VKLLDTNIILEILLGQPKAAIAQRFINSQKKNSLVLSNFSFDSIGLKLYWAKRTQDLSQFGLDLKAASIDILALEPQDLGTLANNIQTWKLDFDDAYQYTLAKKLQLSLVSFDADFDRTDLKRIIPQ